MAEKADGARDDPLFSWLFLSILNRVFQPLPLGAIVSWRVLTLACI